MRKGCGNRVTEGVPRTESLCQYLKPESGLTEQGGYLGNEATLDAKGKEQADKDVDWRAFLVKTARVVLPVPLASADSKPSRELSPAAVPAGSRGYGSCWLLPSPADAAKPGASSSLAAASFGQVGTCHCPGRTQCHLSELPTPLSSFLPPAAMFSLVHPLTPV